MSGFLVYEDDRAAVVVIISASNSKTCGSGPLRAMVAQVYYLPSRASLEAAGVETLYPPRARYAPIRAVLDAGADATCPGACPHRSTARGGSGACYVVKGRTAFALGSVVGRYLRGGYPEVPLHSAGSWIAAQTALVRLGAYGDPTSAPIDVARALATPGGRWTGYTAAWRDCDPAWRDLVMASVSTVDDAHAAQRAGWRTYRTRAAGDPLLDGERVCPAAKEAPTAGRVSCATCRGCDGVARGSIRPSYAINLH